MIGSRISLPLLKNYRIKIVPKWYYAWIKQSSLGHFNPNKSLKNIIKKRGPA
jgi:hypothetical protein